MTQTKTCIIACKKCGFRTRHRWEQWERQPLLFRLLGRVQTAEGWVCTKCGHRRVVRVQSASDRQATRKDRLTGRSIPIGPDAPSSLRPDLRQPEPEEGGSARVWARRHGTGRGRKQLGGQELVARYAAGERDFSRAELSWAKLHQADLSGANLSGSNLMQTDLTEANLSGANLSWASLLGANLVKANLTGATLDETVLHGVDLRQANLSEANLNEAYLSAADLRKANLSKANLRGADLDRADLREAKLNGADLRDARLKEAVLDKADLEAAIVTDEQLAQARSLKGAILPDGTKHKGT